jgi:hypothetical protein
MRYLFSAGIRPTLLHEVGLERLGPEQEEAALRTLAAELEQRVAARLRAALSPSQQAELDQLISHGASESISAFYDRTVPDHANVAAEELARLKAELRANVAIEIAFERLSPIYHDALVRLDAQRAREGLD